MSWYSVRVLLRIGVERQAGRFPLYEDRLILVRAKNHATAQSKAKRLIKKSEKPYKNSDGNKVHWHFQKVYESVELFDERIVDGTQVYWRFIRSADPIKRLKREGTMNALSR